MEGWGFPHLERAQSATAALGDCPVMARCLQSREVDMTRPVDDIRGKLLERRATLTVHRRPVLESTAMG